jgi:hypothetical protein
MVQTSDGGYALAGSSRPLGFDPYGYPVLGDDQSLLVKLNSDGWLTWEKEYGGAGDDIAHSVIQTTDEGFVLAGYTDSFGYGGLDCWLIKRDPTGNVPSN